MFVAKFYDRIKKNDVEKLGKGKYSDGNGLYLLVKDAGSRSWTFKATIKGKKTKSGGPIVKEFGLGTATKHNLEVVRKQAYEMLMQCRAGLDPLHKKTHSVPTFEECAREFYQIHSPGWKNDKHKQGWINSLENHVFPHIGDKLIVDVDVEDILYILTPIWSSTHETAKRISQRMDVIFNAAIAKGIFHEMNPVRKVKDGKLLPNVKIKVRHQPAVPIKDIPKLYKLISRTDTVGRLALRFALLTAVRTGNIRKAKLEQFDLVKNVWHIPAEEMKKDVALRVPLSAEAVKVINLAISGRDDLGGFLFYTKSPKIMISENTTCKALQSEIGFKQYVTHGLRSSFRDWVEEYTNYKGSAAEAALAHSEVSSTVRAYKRSDYFEQRIEMMNDWADYCRGYELGS